MPLTVSYSEGNAATDNQLALSILLPDANGGNASVAGNVQAASVSGTPSPAFSVGPTTIALPAAPGSGSLFFNIQIDLTSGVATLQQSTSAPPSPINANNVIVYSQTLTAATTDPAESDGSTPDESLGAA
jgi:hypothetical protein